MSDLIDRQNLMEQLNELCDKQCPYNEPTKAIGACCSSCAIDDVIELVQQLPSAEKTGKWIRMGWSINCSECGYDMPFTVRNYCPNCGAKMGRE